MVANPFRQRIRLPAAALTLGLAFSMFLTITSPSQAIVINKGDLNKDGTVTTTDVMLGLLYLISPSQSALTPEQLSIGEFDGLSGFGLDDLKAILETVVGTRAPVLYSGVAPSAFSPRQIVYLNHVNNPSTSTGFTFTASLPWTPGTTTLDQLAYYQMAASTAMTGYTLLVAPGNAEFKADGGADKLQFYQFWKNDSSKELRTAGRAAFAKSISSTGVVIRIDSATPNGALAAGDSHFGGINLNGHTSTRGIPTILGGDVNVAFVIAPDGDSKAYVYTAYQRNWRPEVSDSAFLVTDGNWGTETAITVGAGGIFTAQQLGLIRVRTNLSINGKSKPGVWYFVANDGSGPLWYSLSTEGASPNIVSTEPTSKEFHAGTVEQYSVTLQSLPTLVTDKVIAGQLTSGTLTYVPALPEPSTQAWDEGRQIETVSGTPAWAVAVPPISIPWGISSTTPAGIKVSFFH